jgi:hypothetical protein
VTTADPRHVRLGTGRWWLWQDIALRSAGFPAHDVIALCDADLAAVVDSYGNMAYDSVWEHAVERLSRELSVVAADPAFREAVAWQNPHAVVTCVDKVARGEPRNARGRRHEATVATYLQRYCLKNDTIGFFGPVGWARTDPGAGALSVRPGPSLLLRRTTYFETWAVDEVARAIANQEGVFPWLTPRPVVANMLDGQVLHRARGRPVALSETEARLLARCDGTRRVADLLGDPDARDALLRLIDLGAVRVDLEGPVQAWPERRLKADLCRIGDPGVRARALGGLDELVAARARLAAAAGDAEGVLAASTALAEVFQRLTGRSATRRGGRAYAGRTLCYEDTVRDVDVRVGATVLDALAHPLTLVLDSARWLVAEVGEQYRRYFLELFERELARAGGSALRLGRLLVMATPDLLVDSTRALPELVGAVVAEFQRQWSEILAVPAGSRRHAVSSAVIASRVAGSFPARQVAWSAAIQHSPDIMIAATGPDAVARGDFLLVLGEVHLAVNTLESRVFVEQHEDRDRLLAAAETDHGDRRVYLLPRKDSPFVTSRALPPSALLSQRYTYLSPDSESAVTPGPVLPLADLLVERRGDALVVISRTTGKELDFMEVIGEVLSGAVVNAFRPMGEAVHRPRITLDRLVLCRESWCFPASKTSWAFHRDERVRFALARHWRARHGIPELVFFTVPAEVKPVAVHFGSPALVGVLASAVRRAAEDRQATFSITEMLPGPDRLWLRDKDGRRYTSELRFVAVDAVQKDLVR